MSNTLIVKIQDGSGRHIELGTTSVFPDYIKTF